jgi:hypothetical protein
VFSPSQHVIDMSVPKEDREFLRVASWPIGTGAGKPSRRFKEAATAGATPDPPPPKRRRARCIHFSFYDRSLSRKYLEEGRRRIYFPGCRQILWQHLQIRP